MRTTLDIDEDILQAAKELARIEKKTAGQVLSELARRGLAGSGGLGESAVGWFAIEDGIPLMRSGERVVTKEQVDQLIEETALEDAQLDRRNSS